MNHGYLLDNVKVTIASNTTAGAAGATTITSSAIDMAGYDGCCFLVPLGTIVSGSVSSIKVQQSDDDAASDDYTDVLDSAITIADTDDDKLKYVDILRPGKRYLKLLVLRTVQNLTAGGILAIQYQKRMKPQAGITHGTGVAGESWTSKAEGTA